jgi:hypothetical protein
VNHYEARISNADGSYTLHRCHDYIAAQVWLRSNDHEGADAELVFVDAAGKEEAVRRWGPEEE